VRIVHPVLGDAIASGAALRATYSAVAGATPAPSATTPYAVILEPGVYDLGGTGLTLAPFVELIGTSATSVRITSTASGATTGTLVAAGLNNVVRRVTVQNDGGVPFAEAVHVTDAAGVTLDDAVLKAAAATTNCYAVGIEGSGAAELKDTNVTIDASCAGGVGIDVRGIGEVGIEGGSVIFMGNNGTAVSGGAGAAILSRTQVTGLCTALCVGVAGSGGLLSISDSRVFATSSGGIGRALFVIADGSAVVSRSSISTQSNPDEAIATQSTASVEVHQSTVDGSVSAAGNLLLLTQGRLTGTVTGTALCAQVLGEAPGFAMLQADCTP
jgi:hypothetical protein